LIGSGIAFKADEQVTTHEDGIPNPGRVMDGGPRRTAIKTAGNAGSRSVRQHQRFLWLASGPEAVVKNSSVFA
jgi:hypothetical protein